MCGTVSSNASNQHLEETAMETRCRSYRYWTPDELNFVKQTLDLTAAEVADAMGRTEDSVAAKRHILSGYQPDVTVSDRNQASYDSAVNNRERWTQSEDEFLQTTLDEPAIDVAVAIGRTYCAVTARRYVLRRFGAQPEAPSVVTTTPVKAADYGPTCPRCTGNHRGEC